MMGVPRNFALLLILTSGLFCLVVASSCQNETSNRGKVFLLGFVGMQGEKNTVLSVGSNVASTVILGSLVQGVNSTYQIQSGITEIPISKNTYHLQNGIEDKALLLRSASEITVSVMYRSTIKLAGVAMALPTSVISTSYVFASYTPYRSDNANMIIASLQDGTAIKILLKTTAQISYNSHVYLSGDLIQVKLDALQTFRLKTATADLSGTVIESSAPVSALSVNDCAIIPHKLGTCDYLSAQLLPLDKWGHTFIVPPLYPRKAYLVRMFPYFNTTLVSIHNKTTSQTRTLDQGEFWEETLGDEALVITSNRSLQVVEYSFSNGYGPAGRGGDPFMTIVPDIDSFSSDYIFAAEDIGISNNHSVYLAITIQKSMSPGLLLDGKPLQVSKQLAVSRPTEEYTILAANIQFGPHTLNHTQKSAKFAVLVYGYDSDTGLGYSAGMTFPASGCSTQAQPTSTTGETTTRSTTQGANPTSSAPSPSGNLTCYACSEMQSLHYCDMIQHCQINEVCYSRKVQTHHGHMRYSSGCVKQEFCGREVEMLCDECCATDYCNNKGCGEIGLPARVNRGPICMDCRHFKDPRECDKISVCYKQQACIIEEFQWGEQETNFNMGCSPPSECSDVRRAKPLCRKCCYEDYCNTNCTSRHIVSIPIG